MFDLRLWVAQGFGAGRIPLGPGTFGSVVGLGWFALLVASGKLWVFVGGTLAGVALSVWLCGEGERILQRKDPGSVVMDEIAAIPICFAGWMGMVIWKTGMMPGVERFFGGSNWVLTAGIFVAFRFFDIVKPWPVKQ